MLLARRWPSPGRLRSSAAGRVSTNTQMSWSPIALCSSAATTDESTPPDRPSSTSSLPTCARESARWCSVTMVFDGPAGRRSRRCRARSARQIVMALLGVRDLRVELHARRSCARVGHRGDRARSRDEPMSVEALRQRGRRWSPWLIHTSIKLAVVVDVGRCPSSGSRAAHARLRRSRTRDGRTRRRAPPQLRGQRLHAVADAEHRHAACRTTACGAARRALLGYRLRAARQNDAGRCERRDRVRVAASQGRISQ